MRSLVPLVPTLAALVGCGGASAEVEGTAGGIKFGGTDYVYWGARYVVISMVEVECTGVDWVERNYDEGVAPTTVDTSVLQFTFSGDELEEGKSSIQQGGQAQATIVNVSGGVFQETNATAGAVTIDSFDDEGLATGSFETVTFEDGTLSGSFTAEWCRNLKP
ncbi:MAG: hypothetical protein FJ090_20765 [Deltaproteobacteria bacterium]|nr:hypothetical protein [Deltaproteobacteria bacterium]